MFEVRIETWVFVLCAREREPACKLPRFTAGIHTIARPEWHALSLDPGYNFPLGSKHSLNMEAIKSQGGRRCSHRRIVPASRRAAWSASGSVMFLRIHDTHPASLAFDLRKMARSLGFNHGLSWEFLCPSAGHLSAAVGNGGVTRPSALTSA